MKNVIRWTALLLTAAMLAGMLAGCGSEAADDGTSAPADVTSATEPAGTVAPEQTTDAATEPEATDAPVTEAEVQEEAPFIIEPDEILAAKLYYTAGNRQADVTNGKIFRYNVVKGRNYYLTTSLTAQDPGFPLVCYFDAKDKLIGTEFMNSPSQRIEAVEEKLNVPEKAAYIFVNARGVDAIMVSGVRKPTAPESNATARDISILFVGNSLTQDGIAYLPYLLKTYYPEVNFRFYMWYSGGKTLANHYSDFVSDSPCEIFSVAENSIAWSNSSRKMSWILQNYKFDIVCMQEYFNYKSGFASADLKDWNNCRDYITSHYTGGNGLEFISLFHAPKRDRADEIYRLTEQANKLILKETVAQDIIPIGVAVKLAMNTALDKLGDQSHLSPDGTHTQEGLPCLVQTYVALLWLFDRLGINKSVYGLPMRVTQQVYSSINVPGANLGSGVVTGTDAENLLAQEVAIMAYKQSKDMFAPGNPG